MYKKVEGDLNFVAREKQIKLFWKEHNIFKKSIDMRSKANSYVFYDGPPTANGKPQCQIHLKLTFQMYL